MPPKAIRIDIVSDAVCPWCVIGYLRLQKALEKFGTRAVAEIHWLPFELNPQMPEEGENLRDHLARKYGATPQQSIEARQRLTDLGTDLGFEFNYSDDLRMVNTFNAHQLLQWARAYGRETELSLQLFNDFFRLRKDLNDTEVLCQAASAVGLDGNEAREVLNNQTYAGAVRELEKLITDQGISGVPLFVFNREYAISGAQEVETFEQQLQQVIKEGGGD